MFSFLPPQKNRFPVPILKLVWYSSLKVKKFLGIAKNCSRYKKTIYSNKLKFRIISLVVALSIDLTKHFSAIP